jgi:hypothetical protein
MQLVPHGKKPDLQANEHSASTQTGLPCGGALQVVPQERQLFGSSFKTTQAASHTVSPSRQATGPVAAPPSPAPAPAA